MVRVHISPPNYGYLSKTVGNIQGIGGGGGLTVSAPSPGHPDCQGHIGVSVGNFKCYNFNEVWINIIGPTPVAGFYKIPIPEVIPKTDCPPGSENNDPSKFIASDMWPNLEENYPQAVITPPTLNSPPKVEWGPYVPSAPSPTPTTEASPTPTTEPSPTPTTEPSPTPTSP
jgi:hypothetical protein